VYQACYKSSTDAATGAAKNSEFADLFRDLLTMAECCEILAYSSVTFLDLDIHCPPFLSFHFIFAT